MQVRCLRCGAGAEEVIFHINPGGGPSKIVVRCHGERTTVELDRYGPAIRYIAVFEPDPPEPPPASETGLSEIAGSIIPRLKLDGCGGASASGECSCGAAGCRIDDRAPGCPMEQD